MDLPASLEGLHSSYRTSLDIVVHMALTWDFLSISLSGAHC